LPEPALFVAQNPIANAGAVGFDQPFIVISSGTLDLLDANEQRFILGQQLGHIMTGRTTYRTVALILLFFGLSALPVLASLALLPFQLALLEWYRCSEFSADRAGLLATQEPRSSLMSFLKLAGGTPTDDTIDLDAFLIQAAEYEVGGNAWDHVLKALNTAMREHPFHTVRAGELRRWEQSGAYQTIVDGSYVRRGSEAERPLRDDWQDAGAYYAEKARAAAETMGGAVNRAADAFREAFRRSASMGDPPDAP
jgi:Zn-dependent protease with chaperone function